MKRQRVDQFPPGYVGMPAIQNMGIAPLPPHMMAQGGGPPLGPGGLGFGPAGPMVPPGFGAVPDEGAGVPFGFFPVVKLRGLPYGCTEDDIQQFLGLDTVDILKVNRGGRFSGEAYVLLGSMGSFEMCLAKNRTYMGKRYVEVFTAKKMDYYRAVVEFMVELDSAGLGPPLGTALGSAPAVPVKPEPGLPLTNGQGAPHTGPPAGITPLEPTELTPVLKLRGLPYSATQDDIAKWFGAANLPITSPITSANVHLVVHQDGRASGEAYVEFATPEDAKQGMVLHRQLLGSRYIEIFMSTPSDIARAGGQY